MADSEAWSRGSVEWYSAKVPKKNLAAHCATRDVFVGRLDSLASELFHDFPLNEVSLLIAVLAEIGNNVFDHNLGLWADEPGLCFCFKREGAKTLRALVVDRGQGILASLKAVVPELSTDQEALELSFSKVISGRAPERRGNGLKFVRRTINSNQGRGAITRSGSALLSFGAKRDIKYDELEIPVHVAHKGVLFYVEWTQP